MAKVADLPLKADVHAGAGVATHFAEGTFVPVNGAQSVGIPFIALGIDPDEIDDDWLEIRLQFPDGSPSSITSFAQDSPPLNAAKTEMNLVIAQGGADRVTMTVNIIKTDQR
jgi:hypothetical protein